MVLYRIHNSLSFQYAVPAGNAPGGYPTYGAAKIESFGSASGLRMSPSGPDASRPRNDFLDPLAEGEIEGRQGKLIRVKKGQRLHILDTNGGQAAAFIRHG